MSKNYNMQLVHCGKKREKPIMKNNSYKKIINKNVIKFM